MSIRSRALRSSRYRFRASFALRALLCAAQEQAETDRLAQADAEQDRAEALALLKRLKTFTLPAGRMPAAREIAHRCASGLVRWEDGEPVDEADDPASILTVLRGIERELIALGGAADPELAEAVAMVERTFPGARLVEVRRKEPLQ